MPHPDKSHDEKLRKSLENAIHEELGITIKCKHCGHEVPTPYNEVMDEGHTELVCEHCGTRIEYTFIDRGTRMIQSFLGQVEARERITISEIQNDGAWIKLEVACEAAGIDDPWAIVKSSQKLNVALDRMRNDLPEDRRSVFDKALQELHFSDQQRHLANLVGDLFNTPTPDDEDFEKEQKAAVARGEFPRIKPPKIEYYTLDNDNLDSDTDP